MATPEEKLARLKELIAIELEQCNKVDWPYVCSMAANPRTRQQVEKMIIEQCSTSGCTIQAALERIERSFNPNKMED